MFFLLLLHNQDQKTRVLQHQQQSMPVFMFNANGQNANGALFVIVIVLFSMMFFMTLFQTLVEEDAEFKISDLARLKPNYLVKPKIDMVSKDEKQQQQADTAFNTISTQLFSSFLSRFSKDATSDENVANKPQQESATVPDEDRVAPFLAEMRQASHQSFAKTNMGTDSQLWTFPHVTNDSIHLTIVFPRVLNDTVKSVATYYSVVKYYTMSLRGPFVWKQDGEQSMDLIEMTKHVGNCGMY